MALFIDIKYLSCYSINIYVYSNLHLKVVHSHWENQFHFNTAGFILICNYLLWHWEASHWPWCTNLINLFVCNQYPLQPMLHIHTLLSKLGSRIPVSAPPVEKLLTVLNLGHPYQSAPSPPPLHGWSRSMPRLGCGTPWVHHLSVKVSLLTLFGIWQPYWPILWMGALTLLSLW